MTLSPAWLDELRSRITLSAVIAPSVKLTKAGREVVSSTFSPFEVWFTVALLYLVLTGTLSFLVRRLEVKYARSN